MRRDFSKTNYQNPLKVKEQAKKSKFKKLLIIFILVVTISAVSYTLLFSPLFKIKTITITGTNKADWQSSIEDWIIEQQQETNLGFLDQTNIFLFDTQELIQKISNNLDLEYINIQKKYPQSLKIGLKQKTPSLIWQEGNKFYLIDNHGNAIKEISLDSLEFELPIVSFSTTTPITINQKIIDPAKIDFINQVSQVIKKQFKDFGIKNFIMPQTSDKQINIVTSEGWQIYLNTDLDLNAQINNLELLIEQKLKDRSNLQYIDLRLGDRLFYK